MKKIFYVLFCITFPGALIYLLKTKKKEEAKRIKGMIIYKSEFDNRILIDGHFMKVFIDRNNVLSFNNCKGCGSNEIEYYKCAYCKQKLTN